MPNEEFETVEKTQIKVPLPNVGGELTITIKGFQINNDQAVDVTKAVCKKLNLAWTEANVKHSEEVKARIVKPHQDQLEILAEELHDFEEEHGCKITVSKTDTPPFQEAL
ncbi:MAG TPA: hypothetical protein PL124_11060 [Candidatus Cloacimonadota bacterium]|nr:hypothetical protein [Candidatus Cloacimonadota bacterium]